jgi:hypothetical protein
MQKIQNIKQKFVDTLRVASAISKTNVNLRMENKNSDFYMEENYISKKIIKKTMLQKKIQ